MHAHKGQHQQRSVAVHLPQRCVEGVHQDRPQQSAGEHKHRVGEACFRHLHQPRGAEKSPNRRGGERVDQGPEDPQHALAVLGADVAHRQGAGGGCKCGWGEVGIGQWLCREGDPVGVGFCEGGDLLQDRSGADLGLPVPGGAAGEPVGPRFRLMGHRSGSPAVSAPLAELLQQGCRSSTTAHIGETRQIAGVQAVAHLVPLAVEADVAPVPPRPAWWRSRATHYQ